MTFKELKLATPILKAVDEKGYNQPTPIQEQAIPVVLRGSDMFGIAQTGTGKTAAFAIPIIQQLLNERENQNLPQGKRVIKALILTPTRELAIQIGDCFADYGKYTNLRHTTIFGGVKQGPQTEQLQRGVDILIATPGRLLDLINQKIVNLSTLKYFVLDEADRMLDMGFIADIRRLLPKIPKKRQTLFFSATAPATIVSLSRSILHNPTRVEVTPVSSAVETIDQCIYYVEKPEKKGLLISLLKKEAEKSVIIFSRTKHGADNIARSLKKAGIQSEAIHGNKSQNQRQRVLTDFKSGRMKVMVATDIAARGIDVQELEMVINYDLPDVPETYVHRIGRTGRAGHSGIALTFCSQAEQPMVKDIQKLTGRKLQTIPFSASATAGGASVKKQSNNNNLIINGKTNIIQQTRKRKEKSIQTPRKAKAERGA